ncbi:MAG: phosphotransferase, partial [Phenylobacterium sp.]|uniref:phosphotransferase n=1 Tax=Phenylobacterium sp. TaxID=1871053 RepID=UPI001A495007
LSAAHRFLVTLADGQHVFVKGATTPETAAWLRNERTALSAAPPELAPRVLAWLDDDPDRPVLVLEALEGRWPAGHQGVAWRPGDLPAVVDALRRLARAPADGLAAASGAASTGWADIVAAPEAILRLGICSPAWLAAWGGRLLDAEQSLVRTGAAFVHGDMRSDNIWLGADGVKFVDWSHAVRGAPETDLATLLPTAHLEGGPAPASLMPEGGAWAAAQAADMALRAVGDHAAPAWLRRVFGRLAAINLDWAAASLDLAPRDGAPWAAL